MEYLVLVVVECVGTWCRWRWCVLGVGGDGE